MISRRGRKLPPMTSALNKHINRANYEARIRNNAHIPSFEMPSPVGHGWIDENGKLVPLTTLQNPAPDAVLELVQCNCAKSRCSTNCSCRRNDLVSLKCANVEQMTYVKTLMTRFILMMTECK